MVLAPRLFGVPGNSAGTLRRQLCLWGICPVAGLGYRRKTSGFPGVMGGDQQWAGGDLSPGRVAGIHRPCRNSQSAVGYLLVFALLRSFLFLSILVVLVSFGARHWNHSSALDRQLSDTSYDIYLTHFWFVVAIQTALLDWAGGPVPAKVAIVFMAALGLSYAISRWVLARHSRAFVMIILALFIFCLAVRP